MLRELKISRRVFVPELYGRPPTDDRGVLKHAGAYSRKAACTRCAHRNDKVRTRLFWMLAVIRMISVARGDVEISLAISVACPHVPSPIRVHAFLGVNTKYYYEVALPCVIFFPLPERQAPASCAGR